MSVPNHTAFDEALTGLRRGNFSQLEPLFQRQGDSRPQIVEWVEAGRFRGHQQELEEALTCACFNGQTEVAEYLLSRGVPLTGGAATGLNAIHWAVNRGKLDAVRLLIRHKAPLESQSMYGGAVLDTAVWSAIHEPQNDHLAIIEELLTAGSRVEKVDFPTTRADINALLESYVRRQK
jgi:hypothetical protein